jgi:hypothetical protein
MTTKTESKLLARIPGKKLNIGGSKFVLFSCSPNNLVKRSNMPEVKKTYLTSIKISKKEMSKLVYEKFSGVLAEYKAGVNEKKFRNKLKKASKLVAVDLAKAHNKERKESLGQ